MVTTKRAKQSVSAMIVLTSLFMLSCAQDKVAMTSNEIEAKNGEFRAVEPEQVKQISLLPESPQGSEYFATGGSTVEFTPENMEVFYEYAGRTLNNPSKFYITVNTQKMFEYPAYERSVNRSMYYGGWFRIGYFDDGAFHAGSVMVSGEVEKPLRDNYFQYSPEGYLQHFRGYFTDTKGALILIIDRLYDSGDGLGPDDLVNGEVWFYNFQQPNVPYPTSLDAPSYCWELLEFTNSRGRRETTPMHGAFGCRSLFSGAYPTTLENPDYPDRRYKRLGRFSGLSLKASFNLDYVRPN